jgi:hypothetical protein
MDTKFARSIFLVQTRNAELTPRGIKLVREKFLLLHSLKNTLILNSLPIISLLSE